MKKEKLSEVAKSSRRVTSGGKVCFCLLLGLKAHNGLFIELVNILGASKYLTEKVVKGGKFSFSTYGVDNNCLPLPVPFSAIMTT